MLNFTPPIPERPETLDAQLQSTKRMSSPRIAVLYTKGVEIPPLSDKENSILFDVNIPETKETVRIHKAKAKKLLGISRDLEPHDIQEFIKKNGYADLIAKAENVGTDTAAQPGVIDGITARDVNGNELSWSKVTSPQSLAKQIEINKKEFGENVAQKLEPSGKVIEDRLAKRPKQDELDIFTKLANSYSESKSKIAVRPSFSRNIEEP